MLGRGRMARRLAARPAERRPRSASGAAARSSLAAGRARRWWPATSSGSGTPRWSRSRRSRSRAPPPTRSRSARRSSEAADGMTTLNVDDEELAARGLGVPDRRLDRGRRQTPAQADDHGHRAAAGRERRASAASRSRSRPTATCCPASTSRARGCRPRSRTPRRRPGSSPGRGRGPGGGRSAGAPTSCASGSMRPPGTRAGRGGRRARGSARAPLRGRRATPSASGRRWPPCSRIPRLGSPAYVDVSVPERPVSRRLSGHAASPSWTSATRFLHRAGAIFGPPISEAGGVPASTKSLVCRHIQDPQPTLSLDLQTRVIQARTLNRDLRVQAQKCLKGPKPVAYFRCSAREHRPRSEQHRTE